MNQVTLLGKVSAAPVYHCTDRAQDMVKIKVVTYDKRGGAVSHSCIAWGSLALALHEYADAGRRLMLRGELEYEKSSRTRSGRGLAQVRITSFGFID